MSPISKTGLAAQKTPAPVPVASKSHFDTFETKFFEQGDESTSHVAEADRFDDLDDPRYARRMTPSRQFFLGVAVGSVSVALLGGIGLWLTGGRSTRQIATTESVTPVLAQAEPGLAPTPVAVAANPEPTPSQPAGAGSQPTAPQPAVAANPEPVAAQPVAAANAEPAPAPAPVVAPAAPAPAEKPEPVVAVDDSLPAAVGLGQPPAADAVRTICRKAIDGKRNKEILSACPAAFAADDGGADIAVALAKTEFDRGRSARALEWGRKAIGIDPNAADAYVFIGGAEQSAGHGKAAMDAYRRYLQLAPSGRYAADLRAIVGAK